MTLKFSAMVLSSKDVPGRWSLVLFLNGCNFRCKHCQNWKLVLGLEEPTLTEGKVIEELEKNPAIDTVVLSGGEPTVHKPEKLKTFLEKLRLQFPYVSVRIDTNGYSPQVVRDLKPLVDGFAVDIKAPLDDKDKLSYTAGVEVDPDPIKETISIADGMPLTLFRTPRYPWLSGRDLEKIRDFTNSLKSPWFLNEFFLVEDCPFNRLSGAP